jgi:hypothetical protein
MQRSHDEFWHSSIAQILRMIDLYTDDLQRQAAAYDTTGSKPEVRHITSMKEIEGW